MKRSETHRAIHHKVAGTILGTLLLGLSPSGHAATCLPATNDGAGLQGCLESAAPGDTVLLSPGVYRPVQPLVFPAPAGNTFFISKTLTVRGTAPGVVLSGRLDGASAFNVLVINTDADPGPVLLEHLTIEGGDSSTGGFFVGGGIVAAPNQTVLLDGVTVRDNRAALGGGIWPGGGPEARWTVTNSRFQDNVATGGDGGAIRADGTQLLSVDRSEFEGNAAPSGFGGAIHFTSFGSLRVTRSTFTSNTADESGGALTIQGVGFGQSYLVDRCTFDDNRAEDVDGGGGFGGAIDIFSIVQDGRISRSRFTGNHATFGGGAVYFTEGHAVVERSRFRDNHAGLIGGAVGIQGARAAGSRSTNVALDRNRFVHNTAQLLGGAVLAFDVSSEGTARESGLTFTRNRYRRNSAENAGAVGIGVFETRNENVLIEREIYEDNFAEDATGGLALDTVSGSIDRLSFEDNRANNPPFSLFILNSPDLVVGRVEIDDAVAADCLIEGILGCPFGDEEDDDDDEDD